MINLLHDSVFSVIEWMWERSQYDVISACCWSKSCGMKEKTGLDNGRDVNQDLFSENGVFYIMMDAWIFVWKRKVFRANWNFCWKSRSVSARVVLAVLLVVVVVVVVLVVVVVVK